MEPGLRKPGYGDYLLDTPHFVRARLDENVVRAILFFQRREPVFTRRALTFLRCEDMTGHDREYLGGLLPRTADADPLDTLVQIGRLTHCFERQALVLCMDQLEEIWSYNADAAQRFRDAMGAMRALTDEHPAPPNRQRRTCRIRFVPDQSLQCGADHPASRLARAGGQRVSRMRRAASGRRRPRR